MIVTNPVRAKKLIWLIYVSLVLSGLILIGNALEIRFFTKLTARLGIAVIFSAFALLVGKDRPSGIIATAIIWIAVLITFFN